MTIQELIARQQAIVSGARAAGRDLTAEERAEFDGLQRQIDAAGNNPPAQGSEGQGGEDPTGGARGMGNDNGQQGTDPTEAARQAVATERQRVSDITAVSYTHLDVYKRQAKYRVLPDGNAIPGPWSNSVTPYLVEILSLIHILFW